MRKRWMVVFMAALILVLAASPALAEKASHGPGEEQRRGMLQHRWQAPLDRFAVVGTVAAVGSDSITIQVLSGNKPVKPFVGQELVVQVDENTILRRWTEEGGVPIALADVVVGEGVNANGTVAEETFVAARVTAGIPLYCQTP